MPIRIDPPKTAAEVADTLKEIFDDLQDRFHDQWNWMDAYFNVECLLAMAEGRPFNLPEYLAAYAKLKAAGRGGPAFDEEAPIETHIDDQHSREG